MRGKVVKWPATIIEFLSSISIGYSFERVMGQFDSETSISLPLKEVRGPIIGLKFYFENIKIKKKTTTKQQIHQYPPRTN